MDKLIKESQYFGIWLLFWVCSMVGGFVLGAVGGGIVGAILGAARVDIKTIQLICGGVGFILGIALSYVLFRVFVGNLIVKKAQARFQDMLQESPNKGSDRTGDPLRGSPAAQR